MVLRMTQTRSCPTFPLPPDVRHLVEARNMLRRRYPDLSFTLDGKLVGDIGEAIAAELFGVELVQGKGIDGWKDGRSIQVKATNSRLGPAFRKHELRADHLLFFSFDWEAMLGTVIYNGPEAKALERMSKGWTKDQRSLTWNQIRAADADVADADRLPMLIQPPNS